MATATIPAAMFQKPQVPVWPHLAAKAAVALPSKPRSTGPGWNPGLGSASKEQTSLPPVLPENGSSPASTPEEPRVVDPERAKALAEQKVLAELAARCLQGDADAWEKLARSQQRRVYGLCFRFTNSATDAEDLTQEVFLKMYRNLASFDPSKGGFTTWLTTLTRNLLVDNYRRSKLERASDSLDESLDGEDDGPTKGERLMDTGKSQEQHVSGLELKAQIQHALAQISPELREAVILRDLEDMDYKDIADVLGVPQGTVKSRISRGRAELARLLKRIEGQVM
jgi:RNA polymerase sigma-70 factor (ECF subfamily)